MNRLLAIARGHLARAADAPDRQLLDRFLAGRDEAAFAELVRRHGRVVWGTCRRRLANPHDAEDAFQATFLVLLRRAARLAPDTPLGPWLHRVAALTARNVLRGNRRRAAVSGPMGHDVPAPADPAADLFDLDAVLLALPERYRAPVVLCHLEGLSRREAAARLGCPEGTLSSLLSRALARLRARLGGAAPALLAAAGVAAVPAGVSAAAVRTGMVFTTSSLGAAGVSPAVAGLTSGVLRMFWMKKVAAACAAAALVAGGLSAGLTGRSGDGVARATEPLAGEPQAPAEDPDGAAKRLEKRLADLQKQKELLDATLADLQAERAGLDSAKKAKDAAAELGKDIAVSVGGNRSGYEYTVREVIDGKVAEVHTSDVDILRTYLTRAFNDPKGPKKLRLSAAPGVSLAQVNGVFAAGAAAGYRTASFSHVKPPVSSTLLLLDAVSRDAALRDYAVLAGQAIEDRKEERPAPGEIDLTKYAPKRP